MSSYIKVYKPGVAGMQESQSKIANPYSCLRKDVGKMVEQIDLGDIRKSAENYYASGDFYCSEAVVKTIKDAFKLNLPDDVIAMASGFPVGIGGAGCNCGAVAGAVMAIGMVFGRTKPQDPKVTKAMELSKEIHDVFQSQNATLCCRVLTKDMQLGSTEHMSQCVAFTGDMAAETAKIIARELKVATVCG